MKRKNIKNPNDTSACCETRKGYPKRYQHCISGPKKTDFQII